MDTPLRPPHPADLGRAVRAHDRARRAYDAARHAARELRTRASLEELARAADAVEAAEVELVATQEALRFAPRRAA